MRIIAIGDIHGRSIWKQIVASEKFDKIVFVGDYFDSHEEISALEQISNFKEIMDFKNKNPHKVALLVGNHDFHYMRGINDRYSGFQAVNQHDISSLIQEALNNNLLQMCYTYENMLFSHAGITKTWLNNVGYKGDESLDVFVNGLFKCQPSAFKFTKGINNDPYGDDITQPPIWVRPQSLLHDMVDGYVQVVGHTYKKNIVQFEDAIFIDTLGESQEYLIWDNFNVLIGKIKNQTT